MKSNLKISIPQPCSQQWDDMQAIGSDRYCASCEKTVHDFTKMDDSAFIAYFQNAKEPSCGRFLQRQLALDIPLKQQSLLPFRKMSKYIAASVIATASLTGRTAAQERQNIENNDPVSEEKKAQPSLEKTADKMIKGRLVDNENIGIPGASVVIDDLNLTTQTDADGRFEFNITPDPKIVFYDLDILIPENWTIINHKVNIYTQPEINIIKVNETMVFEGTVGGYSIYKPSKWRRFKGWIKNNFL